MSLTDRGVLPGALLGALLMSLLVVISVAPIPEWCPWWVRLTGVSAIIGLLLGGWIAAKYYSANVRHIRWASYSLITFGAMALLRGTFGLSFEGGLDLGAEATRTEEGVTRQDKGEIPEDDSVDFEGTGRLKGSGKLVVGGNQVSDIAAMLSGCVFAGLGVYTLKFLPPAMVVPVLQMGHSDNIEIAFDLRNACEAWANLLSAVLSDVRDHQSRGHLEAAKERLKWLIDDFSRLDYRSLDGEGSAYLRELEKDPDFRRFARLCTAFYDVAIGAKHGVKRVLDELVSPSVKLEVLIGDSLSQIREAFEAVNKEYRELRVKAIETA